ncbi:MAG: hypothetical protein OEM96_05480 [Gemmatimonadota bacterium]|nr:hypothetical protein [Gemmatimonadota bacterium]
MNRGSINHILALAAIASLSWTATVHGQQSMAMPDEPYEQLTAADAAGLEAPALPDMNGALVSVRTLADERLVEFDIGPIELKAGMAHLRLPIQLAAFPVDGWIHGFEVAMVDGEGNELPMDLLHHVNFIDPDKRELFSSIARRVMAAGRETLHEQLPRLIGYPVSDGDRMLIASMFANTLGQDYPDAHLLVRFQYTTEADGFFQPRNVYPFYLDVMGPIGGKDFPVPPGKTVQYWEGQPAVDGRILGIGGHLHDHASKLSLLDMTTGKTVWETGPERNAEGRVTGVPSGSFMWTLGRKIFADHTYRISVEYDNPLDVPAPDGGMGAIGGVVWVGKNTAWPEFDRGDDMYVADLINTLQAPANLHGHGTHAMGDAEAGMGSEAETEHAEHQH